MKNALLTSDQLHNWSDIYEQRDSSSFKTTAQTIVRPTAYKPQADNFERIPHRTLQTLWQTKLQMCRGERARSQILSFDKHAWISPRYDLRSSKSQTRGRKGLGQLPPNKKYYGAAHSCQQRIIHPRKANTNNRFWWLNNILGPLLIYKRWLYQWQICLGFSCSHPLFAKKSHIIRKPFLKRRN